MSYYRTNIVKTNMENKDKKKCVHFDYCGNFVNVKRHTECQACVLRKDELKQKHDEERQAKKAKEEAERLAELTVESNLALDDYTEALEIDRSCRFQGVERDLYHLPLRKGLAKRWSNKPPVPTIFYNGISQNKRNNINNHYGTFYSSVFIDLPTSDNEFCSRFYQAYPFLKGMDFTGILIAGGAISRLLKYPAGHVYGHNGYLNQVENFSKDKFDNQFKAAAFQNYDSNKSVDLDIFFYGLSVEQANAKIHEIQKFLQNYIDNEKQTMQTNMTKNKYNVFFPRNYNEGYHMRYTINKNVLTIFFPSEKLTSQNMNWYNSPTQEIQLIFRLYSSKSEILHGFDLGSSAVGFDGQQVYFTSLSKFAYEYGLNIVDTTRRSTSYEWRLSKYMKRGFNLVIPQLDVESCIKIRTKNKNDANHLGNNPFNRNNIDVRDVIGLPYIWIAIVDYDLKTNKNSIYGYVQPRFNDDYKIVKCDYQQNTVRNDFRQWITDIYAKYNYQNLMNGKLDAIKIYGTNFEQIINYQIDIDDINSHIKDNTQRIINKLEKLNLPGIIVTFNDEMSKKHANIQLQIESMKSGITWIVDNPGTQLTSSINPIFDDEWKWYGTNFYVPTGHIRQQTIIGSFLGHKNMIERLFLFYSIERRDMNKSSTPSSVSVVDLTATKKKNTHYKRYSINRHDDDNDDDDNDDDNDDGSDYEDGDE